MPKGNKVSNFPTNQPIHTLPGEMGKVVAHFDELRQLEPVGKDEPEKVRERVDDYFAFCSTNDIKPTVEGLSICCGRSRQCLWKWQQEPDCEAGRIIERAKDAINAILTSLALDSKVNQIYVIWLQKNNYGYTDQRLIEVVPMSYGRRPKHSKMDLLEDEENIIDVDLPIYAEDDED